MNFKHKKALFETIWKFTIVYNNFPHSFVPVTGIDLRKIGKIASVIKMRVRNFHHACKRLVI